MKLEEGISLNTDLFRAAIEIERCGSISHAASNLSVSQPNLSAQVKNLEARLGYKIFDRSNTGVRVTEQGKLFMDSARIIVSELENIRNVPRIFEGDEHSLSIACVPSVVILNHYLRFRSLHPANESHDVFQEASPARTVSGVMDGAYRLGFIYEFKNRLPELRNSTQRRPLEFETVASNVPVLAIMSKHHPLAKLESISLEALSTTPLVAFDYLKDGSWLETMGMASPREVLYVSDRGGALEVVTYGRHVGISVGTPFFNVHNDDLAQVPITGVKRRICQYLIKPENYEFTPTEQEFLKFVKKEGLVAATA
ncbi:LysR family transcriptional regulator [Slackia heliotrinireducens]|uniref:Transcriptional regulator n=1 Tax=Slackia heliotrinireducens (strain ATCC 29202 / DSM 20476 / NCTC 11029 / RHS 1) TaxID=471855 RepID=C7N3R8_SLAHD|nr:LysR family transcriptional regulator [Slackia heliotrinireducens]ACV21659.1 transcriptional regulator [Slackia heliotrinireducens DSM 20476]VEG99260.1 Cyn operon transcriptional activator [Slackia heliotrinireducens]